MMENEYAEKIETLLGEYLEYRKAKENIYCDEKEVASMSDIKINNKEAAPFKVFPAVNENISEFRWFPNVISENPGKLDVFKEPHNQFNEKTIKNEPVNKYADESNEGMKAVALSDNVSKLLEPFAVLEVDKMDYKGSPIYSDLDKDTLSQMTVSAYTNAVLNVTELGDLEAQSASCSREQMLRSLIRELIIKEIFFLRRSRG